MHISYGLSHDAATVWTRWVVVGGDRRHIGRRWLLHVPSNRYPYDFRVCRLIYNDVERPCASLYEVQCGSSSCQRANRGSHTNSSKVRLGHCLGNLSLEYCASLGYPPATLPPPKLLPVTNRVLIISSILNKECIWGVWVYPWVYVYVCRGRGSQ